MRKAGIIGLGHVGAALAYTLVKEALVDELVLIDQNEALARSEQYDLLDAQVYCQGKTKLIIQDYEALKDADIVVFCAGDIRALGADGDRFKELLITSKIAAEVAPKIVASGFSGILVSITNPCDVIVTYLQKLTGFPPHKVIGTGTLLDTARMKQAVAKELAIDSQNVAGFVYGEHGDSQFVAWSTVTVANQSLEAWQTNPDFAALEEKVRDGGWQAYAGKGYTSHGIATCTAQLMRWLLNDTPVVAPVACYDEMEKLYYGQPALITRQGISRTITYSLTSEEEQKLAASIAIIRSGLAQIQA